MASARSTAIRTRRLQSIAVFQLRAKSYKESSSSSITMQNGSITMPRIVVSAPFLNEKTRTKQGDDSGVNERAHERALVAEVTE